MNTEKKLSLREVQLAEYGILTRMADFMEANGISYILCGGTLLGAVRHNGFIPWDDDIDILVPRKDYDRLISLIRENRDRVEGIHCSLPGDADHLQPFIKAVDYQYICQDERVMDGITEYIWMDIFPMDHFPDGKIMHRLWEKRLVYLRKILDAGILGEEYWKKKTQDDAAAKRQYRRMYARYRLAGGYRKLDVKIDRTARLMNWIYRKSNHVGDGAWPCGMKDYFTMESVRPTVDHLFEDRMFKIPQNYDLYLSHFYGDYMTLPPEEKRGGHYISVYRNQTK